MNTYTHLGLEDAKNEMIRLEELEQAKKEIKKTEGRRTRIRICSEQFNMDIVLTPGIASGAFFH